MLDNELALISWSLIGFGVYLADRTLGPVVHDNKASAKDGALLMKVRGSLPSFMTVLDYELRCASRYRRYVTLVAAYAKDASQLKGFGRDCDLWVENDGSVFVLMAETPPEAARQALVRYLKSKATQGEQIYLSVTSFPEDGATADGLLQTGLSRLAKAPALSEVDDLCRMQTSNER